MLTASTLDDIDLDLPGPPRGQGPDLVLAARATAGCSSPPTGCRRSTGSIADRAVQGSGAQRAVGVVVRRDGGHRRQPPPRRARPERARSPARPTPLPVEVVVRGHITGVTSTSLWAQYEAGSRIDLRAPLPGRAAQEHRAPGRRSSRPPPKPTAGGHDEPISCADVVATGLVAEPLWERVVTAALALFAARRRSSGGGRADPRRHEVRVRPVGRRRASCC